MTTKNSFMKVVLMITVMIGSAIRAESPNRMSEQSRFDELMSAAEKAVRENEQKGAANKNNDKINPEDAKFGSGMAQGIFENQTAGVQGPLNNETRNNSNSREDGLLDMQSQASTGAGLAVGIGAAMMATGVPMSLDIFNIPRMVAGLELIAKGAIEIAQGASLASDANNYNSQRNTLNGGESVAGFTAPQIPVDNEQLKGLLQGTGISPDEFRSRLASGEFQSSADILKALGKEVDAEALKEGQKLAEIQMGGIIAKAKEELDLKSPATVTADPKNEKEGASGGSQNATASNSSNPSDSSSDKKDSESLASGNSSDKNITQEPHNRENRSLASTKPNGSDNDFMAMYNKLFGAGAKGVSEEDKALFRQQLAEMGISLPIKGISIFSLARRQFIDFGEYRRAMKQKQTRVAKR